jgi:hypothetical protein
MKCEMGFAGCVLGAAMVLGGCAGPAPKAPLNAAQLEEAERVNLAPRTAIGSYREAVEVGIAADARLLYVTEFASGQGGVANPDPTGSPIMRTLEVASLAAAGFDKAYMLEPPWAVFLSMGMPTSDELARNGYLGAKALLSKPSLTLVGVLDAKGTPIGTPAYGAKIGELFAGGDRLMRAADLGCEPGAKWLFGQSLNGELYQRHTGSIWYPNVSRRRGYACSKIQGDALDITRMNTVQVFPSPRERREVKKDFGMVGLTGTVTAQDDPFALVTFQDLTQYPGFVGNDAAWGLLEKIQDEIPVGWYFVLSGSMPGDPSGALQVVVGQKNPDGFRVARYDAT